jgi:hypothetical protein
MEVATSQASETRLDKILYRCPDKIRIDDKHKLLRYIFGFGCQAVEHFGEKPLYHLGTLNKEIIWFAGELVRRAEEEYSLTNKRVALRAGDFSEIPLEVLRKYDPKEYARVIKETEDGVYRDSDRFHTR